MSKQQIMVVEDEGLVAADLVNRLETLGYGVPAWAASAEEAEAKAAETRPDLVLMDVVLKGRGDGVEAAKNISGHFGIPIVFLTWHSDDATIQRAKTTAPFGYIVKPFQDNSLRTTIEIALHRSELENQLKKLERWLTATLKSIADAVIATDKNGHISFMNPIAEAITGWKQSEAMGRNLTEVFCLASARTGSGQLDPVAKALREGVVVDWTSNNYLLPKTGPRTPIDFTASSIRNEHGVVTGIVLVFRDISPRKQAEEERENLIQELQSACAKVKTLSGLLPICSGCKKIRDSTGSWQEVEAFIVAHTDTTFSHSCCPDCVKKLYPDLSNPGLDVPKDKPGENDG
jgi:PAS domain S-box-containing protein